MSALPFVSVVITGYRRPDLLKDTVHSFLEVTDYPRERMELILTDDGSPPELQDQMLDIPFDKYILSVQNQGLGPCANRGLRAARGDFILQLQDDWHCQGPPDYLRAGIEVLDEFPEVGLIRMRQPEKHMQNYPHDVRQTQTGRAFVTYQNTQPTPGNTSGEYTYTHNPHLKRQSFHEVLGLYPEDIPMKQLELAFCKTVVAQQSVFVAGLLGYDVFLHTGAENSMNPNKKRVRTRERLLANPITRYPFKLYLWGKHGVKSQASKNCPNGHNDAN